MQVGGAGPLQSKGACAISCASGGVLGPCNQRGRARYRVQVGGAGPCNQRRRARYRVQVGGAGPLQSKGACAISCARGGCWAPAIKGGVRDIVCTWGVLGPCNQRGRARYRVQVGGAGPLQSKGACAISCANGGCWAPAIKGGVRDIVCKWGVLGPCNQRGRARYRVQVGGAGPLQSKGACAISCASGGCAISCASGVCWAPAIKGGVRDIVCKWGVLGPCNQRGRARYRVHVGGAGQVGGAGPNQRGRARYRVQVGGAGPLQSKGACVISCASGGCWAPAIKGGVRDIVCKWGVLGPCNQRGRARYRVHVGGAGPLQSKGACAISCASGGCWAPAIKGGVHDSVCKWRVLGPCNQRGRARYRVQVGGAGPLHSKGACAISCASGGCWAPAIKEGVRDIVCKWGVLGPCNQRGRVRYRVQVGGAGPLQSKGACAISCASVGCWASGGCWAPAIKGGVRDIVCKWGMLGPCNQRGRARYRVQVGGAGPLQSKGACAISCTSGGCWAPAIKGGVRDIVCEWGCAGPLQSKGACAISCASGGCWAPAIKGGVRDIVCKWGVLGPCNQRGRARYRVQVGCAGPLQSKGACAISCASGGCWAPAIKGGVRDILCKWAGLGPCNQRGRARYRVQVGGAGPLQSKRACAISCASERCWAPAIKGGVRDIVCKWGVLGPCNQRGRARYRVQVGGAGPLQSKGACAISWWGVLGPCNQRGRVRYRVQVKGAGPCNQRGRARYRVHVGGAGPLHSKGACAISCARGGCWAPAIKGGVRDIVCKWGVLGPCNQRGRARYRLQGLARYRLCNQRGRARYRLQGRGQRARYRLQGGDIVCKGGCWTLAIKGGVRDIVCKGGCWALAIKGGVRDIVCNEGGAGPLQSKGLCEISSARGGCWACNQRGRARNRRQGGRACAISSAVRDIVCKECWALAIKGACAISSARGVLGPIKGGVRDVVVLGAGHLQSKQACARSSARAGGGCWALAIKGGARDIVCKGGVLGPCNQRGRARYRLQGLARYRLCNQRGRARYCLVGGRARYCLQGGVLGPCNQRGRARFRLQGGVLGPCNQRGRARYRLQGGVAGPLQSKGACAISCANGGCWTLAIKGGVRLFVCKGGGAGPLQSKGACAISSARGGVLGPIKGGACAISSARAGRGAGPLPKKSCCPLLLHQVLLSPGWFSGSRLDLVCLSVVRMQKRKFSGYQPPTGRW